MLVKSQRTVDNKTAHSQTEDPAAKQCPYRIKLGPKITIACRYQKITVKIKWSVSVDGLRYRKEHGQ